MQPQPPTSVCFYAFKTLGGTRGVDVQKIASCLKCLNWSAARHSYHQHVARMAGSSRSLCMSDLLITHGGHTANVCKDLVIPASCSFCRGNSRGTNFDLSLTMDVEVDSGLCTPKIAIPPEQFFQLALLVLWSRVGSHSLGAKPAMLCSRGGRWHLHRTKALVWPVCACLCLSVSKLRMVLDR